MVDFVKNSNPSYVDEDLDSKKQDDFVRLNWWTVNDNFGDLLSPWLVERMSGKEVIFDRGVRNSNYLAIGSIIEKAKAKTTVWGSGAFGTESSEQLCKESNYLAVRGPLTRNLLNLNDISCPEVYGDPALLVPFFYSPVLEKKYEVGVVLRWSEKKWNSLRFGDGVKKIYLGTDNVEGVLNDFLECKRIISTSLHGIIIADAYNIPSCWVESKSPKGLKFKFYDYMLSVNKIQKPQSFSPTTQEVSLADLLLRYEFDDKKIEFDHGLLLGSCPFYKNNLE